MSVMEQKGKIIGSILISLLWICSFLFIKTTLVFDFGGGVAINLLLMVIVLELLIIIFYNIFYRSSPSTTKLSLTVWLTLSWLALIIFYPYRAPENTAGGAVGFWTLVGGLGLSVLWVYFVCDENALA